jgi:predicted neuraminidase
MRDQRLDGRVAVAQTLDGGQNWTDLPDLALHNPDASVAALALAPGRMFLVHNALPKGRSVLDLSASADGQNWVLAQTLARGAGDDEYSYPALAWADGSLWVSYTEQRKAIAWRRFSLSAPVR